MMNGSRNNPWVKRRQRRLGRASVLCLLVCALGFTFPAWAQNQVLVIGDVSRSYVRSYVAALSETLKHNGVSTDVIDIKDSQHSLEGAINYRCIVSVGHDAARATAQIDTGRPVLHALVTDKSAAELYKTESHSSARTYLLVEQPVARLLLLAKIALPQRKRIGVLYGPGSTALSGEVTRDAQRLHLDVIEKEIDNDTQIESAILYFKKNADLFITLPDPLVVNEGTVKSLILGAYLRNLPLLGYSKALVKAGAMMGVHSTPEQLGVQSAEMIDNSYWTSPGMNGKRVYPSDFLVSVNYQVARSLGVDLPDEETLASEIKKAEMTQ